MSGQYRLLAGDHQHNGKMFTPGQIIVSDFDLTVFNVPGYRPKFENIAGTTGADNLIFDPKTESLEAFTLRAKAAMAKAPAPGDSQVWDQRVESLEQFYQRMQGKLHPEKKSQPSVVTGPATPLGNLTAQLQGGAVTAVATLKTPAQLEAMSLQDLQRWAESEEVDLGHAKSKAEVIKVIRTHQGN